MSHLPQGSLLPLIRAGDIVSIWHDVILSCASPDASNAPLRASPRTVINPPTRDAPTGTIPLLNFICTSSKSSSFAASLAGRRRRLALDGSVKVDDSEQRPWNLGIIPQTCVLAPSPATSATSPSALPADRPIPAADDDLYPFDSSEAACDPCDPFSRPDSGAAFPVILDNAPLEAVEVGAKERDPGDVFPVLPLLALPVRLRSGLGSEVSWKLVVVAADDPLVLAHQVEILAETILPRVKAWAAGGFGGFAGGSAGGLTDVDPDRWWIPESPQRDSGDWEEAARKAQSVVLEVHSIWKLLVSSLRRPTLQRRQRVSERTVQGWQDKGGAGDDGSSSLLQLVARPGAAGGLGGFGGGKTRGGGGNGRGGLGSGAVAGGKGGLSRGRCSAAAAAAAVAAAEGGSARSEAGSEESRGMGGEEGEEGREGEGTRQLRRAGSVEDLGSSGRSGGGRSSAGNSSSGGKRRGVLPQISPRALSMTNAAARVLVKTATWSRGSSISCGSGSSDSASRGVGSKSMVAGSRSFAGIRSDGGSKEFNRSETCNADDAASTRARSRSKSPSPRSFASNPRGLSSPGARESHFDENSLGHGVGGRRRDSLGRVTSVGQPESGFAGFNRNNLAGEIGELGDTSDLGEAVKSKTDANRMWNSGRLGFSASFGSKSGAASTRSTFSRETTSTWGGLDSSFHSGPLFGMFGKSRTIRESDGQQIPKARSWGWHGKGGTGNGGGGGSGGSAAPEDGSGGGGGGGGVDYGGSGDASGYSVTSGGGGGERARSGARVAFSRSNTASSTYSFVSVGSMASTHSTHSAHSAKSPTATPDLAASATAAPAAGYCGTGKSHRFDRLVVDGPSGAKGRDAGGGENCGGSRPFTPPLGRSKTDPHNFGSGGARRGCSQRNLSPSHAHAAAGLDHDDNDDDSFTFSPVDTPPAVPPGPVARPVSASVSASVSPLESPPALTRRWSLASQVSFTGNGGAGPSGREVFDAAADGAEGKEEHGQRGSKGRHGGREAVEWAAEGYSDECSNHAISSHVNRSHARSSHASCEHASRHYEHQPWEQRKLPKSPSLPKSPTLTKSPSRPKSPSWSKSPQAPKNGLRGGITMEHPHPADSDHMWACESSRGGSSSHASSEVPQTRGGARSGVRSKQRGQQHVPECISTESEAPATSESPTRRGIVRSATYDHPPPQLAAAVSAEPPLPEPPGRRFAKSHTEAPQRRIIVTRPQSSSGARGGGGFGGTRGLDERDMHSRPPKVS
ncbi:hypothetical protein CLOM_g2578 [Closterium sp. NIES-68]|nr:hypothetical protein CLOM_g2578 [Closterium sp. NIES-68]GJP77045.1 hypothetical protein CLOP_g7478 [Closterium sp. NIES-67]